MTLVTLTLLAAGLGFLLLAAACGLWLFGFLLDCFGKEEAAWEDIRDGADGIREGFGELRDGVGGLRQEIDELQELFAEIQRTGGPDLRKEAATVGGALYSLERARVRRMREKIPLKRED
jgi:hypothetical protein